MAVERYFILERKNLVYLQFVLESYEGIGIASTVDQERGLVRVTTDESMAADLDGLLAALGREMPMTETQPPPAEERDNDAR